MLLLLIKHGCTTMNLREKQNIEQTVGAQRKPIANGKRNFTSEEGVVSNILPLQWNHAAKAVPRREGCHWEILLSEVNPFYKRVPPNIELHGITILHDSNTPAHKSKSSARVLA